MGENSVSNLQSNANSSPHHDNQHFSNFNNAIPQFKNNPSVIQKRQPVQNNQADYSYGSITHNITSNGSQIGSKGGGFFPNLRAKQRESNLAQNGSNSIFPHKNNTGFTRMVALPSLNDSNLGINNEEQPSSSYFHTSSNQQLIPSTSSYQFSL